MNNTYKELPWNPVRNMTKDFLDLARDRNFIFALAEIDVTKVMKIFEERKKAGNEANSIITYLMWSYAQAINRHPEIQAKKTKTKVFLFNDVDIAVMVEKDLPGGKKFPFPYIFRGVQAKTYDELNAELRKVKEMDLNDLVKKKKSVMIKWLPRWLRMYLVRRRLSKDPVVAKEIFGTVALTSLGMVLKDRRWWPVPIGPYPCIIGSGAVFTRRETDGEKQFLCLTVGLDHDLIDGAPGARFGQTLIEIMESTEGLV